MNTSPFPGLDPYLEASWRDVHHKLCTYACDDIQSQLGEGLLARVDERLVVEVPYVSGGGGRSIYPDVRVLERRGGGGGTVSPQGVALAEPITVDIVQEDHYEGFIEIIDRRAGGRVITVIEFLSPSNKVPGPNRDQYLRKQREAFAARVSLVEIDLLRSGDPVLPLPDHLTWPELQTPYRVTVHRGWRGISYQIYPIGLRQALPAIAVPLRESDPDVALDLQSLMDRVYRNGAYHLAINYAQPPVPPLSPDDEAWADALLRAGGRR